MKAYKFENSYFHFIADDNALSVWLSDPMGSNEVVYARGEAFSLARICNEPLQKYADVTEARHYLQEAMKRGVIALVQRRLGENDYEYIAQRTTKGRALLQKAPAAPVLAYA